MLDALTSSKIAGPTFRGEQSDFNFYFFFLPNIHIPLVVVLILILGLGMPKPIIIIIIATSTTRNELDVVRVAAGSRSPGGLMMTDHDLLGVEARQRRL